MCLSIYYYLFIIAGELIHGPETGFFKMLHLYIENWVFLSMVLSPQLHAGLSPRLKERISHQLKRTALKD